MKKIDKMKVVINEMVRNSKESEEGRVLQDLVQKMSLIMVNGRKQKDLTEKDLLLLEYLNENTEESDNIELYGQCFKAF